MSAEETGNRFSATAYAAKLSLKTDIVPGERTNGITDSNLLAYTEEVRHMLATPRGWSEEERRRYAEKLNRAIIGFPQERAEMLAIISDWIIKKRLQHLSFGNVPTRRWRKLCSRR